MTWLTTVCTEREPDGTYEDCTWASGVMFANEREGYRKHPQTQAEYEGLRADGDDPVMPGDPGSNLDDLSKGLTKRYGWTGSLLTTWTQVAAVPVGTALVVQGLYSALPTRLRRWSKFTGGHAVCVVRIGTGWWWLDPLAPKDYAGESITTDELKAYFTALAGAKVMAIPVGSQEVEVIKAIKGEDWKPTRNATTLLSNGVLRDAPSRAAQIVERVDLEVVVRSIAEVAANGDNWRLTKRNGQTLYMLRSDWVPLVQGGDPAVDAGLTAYIARTPVPAPDCTAAVEAAVAPLNASIVGLEGRIAGIKAKVAAGAVDVADD